jgi:phage tail protein X
VEATYAAWLWLAGRVSGFPSHERRTLGDQLLAAAVDVLDALHEAAYAPTDALREQALRRANHRLATWRLLARGAHDLRCLSHDQHAFHGEALGRLGAEIGRWLNAVRGAS